MFCKNCGKEINQEVKFCKFCGEKQFEDKQTDSKYAEKPAHNVSGLTPEELVKYHGLQGWLTLVILGLFVMTGYGVYNALSVISTSSEYGKNTDLFLYDLISGSIIAFLGAYVIYLFFKMKKEFKKYYIIFWLVMVASSFITYAIVSSYTSDSSTLDEYIKIISRNCMGAVIWGLYAAKSKRVKATFIN